jgi:hypothetical protein
MIITSHMQTIIEIYPCLLKLSRKQEGMTDGCYYYIPSPLSWGDNKNAYYSALCHSINVNTIEYNILSCNQYICCTNMLYE